MPGETNLDVLLRSMRPVLKEGEYVFCTLPHPASPDLGALAPVGLFHEDEGLTLILRRERADGAGLPYSGTFRLLTLSVHSSLDAVGFIAAVSTRLAAHGIGVNPVAAYHHDHLFIPAARAPEALALLESFTR
ncbi:ACT domain-containing protein [Pyxidicoccus xibeiensis]|uniref:ACT domain-containing protein n=1 Tax=Pyxidicoccus xibeiensis TaxID=2906759 RepID=UPI0020A7FB55|nr:ACT domain-containing protein [Pyxidicoccus xibeiensis]MCP3144509.1 ACT domain-containing protein [Pyxidicoccus xibeiensis]